jgi:hypothetical protein
VVRVGGEEPLAHGAGHCVEVIAVISRSGGDDMVTAWNQDEIVVVGAD